MPCTLPSDTHRPVPTALITKPRLKTRKYSHDHGKSACPSTDIRTQVRGCWSLGVFRSLRSYFTVIFERIRHDDRIRSARRSTSPLTPTSRRLSTCVDISTRLDVGSNNPARVEYVGTITGRRTARHVSRGEHSHHGCHFRNRHVGL